MKKLLLVAILMLALVFTVVACNNEPADTTAGETTATQTPATAEPEDSTEAPEVPTEAPEVPTEAPEVPTEPETTVDDTPVTSAPPVVTTEPETEAPVDPDAPALLIGPDQIATNAPTGNLIGSADKMTEGSRTFVRLTTKGGDPFFTLASSVGVMPDYLVVSYRTNGALDGQFFIGSGGGPNGSGDFFNVNWNENGDWNLAIIDLTTCGVTSITDGNINYLRMDFFVDAGAAGDYFDVEYVAFFNTPAAAEKYNFEQHKAPMWDIDKSVVTHQSFDELDTYAGGNKVAGVFAPGASAGWDKIVTLSDFSVDTLRYWGWIGAKGELGQFGYQINGGAAIYDDAWTHATEQPVIDAAATTGADCASRMQIMISLAGLDGENNVRVLYKTADGIEVCLNEFTVILPEKPKDIKDTFTADVNSQELGVSLDASDLSGFFTVELPLGSDGVVANGEGKMYSMTAISDMYADVNGKYFIQSNNLTSNNGFMFVRGYKVVNSDEIIEKFDPAAGFYKINNFYEQDMAGQMGGAGIYARLEGGTLYIMVKYYNAETVTRVGNKIYSLAAEGTELTMADDGEVVSILVNGKTYATIALSGSTTYADINEVIPKNGFAASAVVTLADGKTETIENTLIAETCECQVGVVVRGGHFKFDALKVGAYSAIEIPEIEVEEPRENIALNKPVSSDNIENEANIPSNATDGDEATRFGALPTGEVKLVVDLEGVYALDDMKVLFENASCEYEIAVSVDGVNYTTIYTDANHGAATKNIKDLGGINARYILFHRLPTAAEGHFWFSIYELYVYGEKVAEPELTPEEIVDAAYALENGAALEGTYTLTGVITAINTPYSEQYKNITVTIQIGDLEDKPIMCYRLKGEGAADLKVTDTITVTGSLKNYNGTIEFDAGCTLDAVVPGEGPAEPVYTTPEEIVNAAYALEVGASLTREYTLTGVITSVDTVYSEQYKNVTVTMVIGNMANKPIQCFRLKGEGADVIAVGDTITVTGILMNYNSKIEFNSGCILNSFVPAPIPEPVPGSEELPLVWDGAYAVDGTHDVWFTYTATESGIWAITVPEGNYVSGMTFNKLGNAYSVYLEKDQTIKFNLFGATEGAYTSQTVDFTGAALEGLFVDETVLSANTAVLPLVQNAFSALTHVGSVEFVGTSVQFVYNLNGVVSEPVDAIEANGFTVTVPADALEIGGNLIKIGAVIDGVTVVYFWEYTVVLEPAAETEPVVDSDWNVMVHPDDDVKPVPEYVITEEGFTVLPADWTNTTPFFTVQTKDAWALSDGFYMQLRVDEYSYDGEYGADQWIGLTIADTVNVQPGSLTYGNNWLCLIRGEGNGTAILQVIVTDVESALFGVLGHVQVSVPMDDAGREIYDFEVVCNDGVYEIKVNGVVVPGCDVISEYMAGWQESDEYYIGASFYTSVADGTAGCTILNYGKLVEDEPETEAPVVPEEPALPTTPEEIVNAAYGLAEGETLEGTYTLTGVITAINTPYSEQYGNISVWMQIGDMADMPILCFRLAGEGAADLKVGDTITVTGTLTNYYGKIEYKQGCTLDAVVPGPEEDVPVIEGVTITFADHTYRTEEGEDYQIFTNDGFVFTQKKGEATSWNATFIGPIRLYAKHEVTIAYAGMTKIIIDGNPDKPISGWVDSITDNNATVTVDGTTVTIEFATPVDSFTVVFAAQVRVNAITVCAE